MSWEAVAWANRQKMKKSYEQIVLLVLGNCADKDGEAFAKWPYKDHWWHYLSERTRLPRSSLFRHLNTIVALGLGTKSTIVLADGTKRPSIKLNMEADFDIERAEDAAKYKALFLKHSDDDDESPVETHDESDAEYSENDHDFNGPKDNTETESPVETGEKPTLIPESGTRPFPVLGMHKDSTKNSNLSPLPPSGGASASDDLDWRDFVKAWHEPIQRLGLTRTAFERVATDKRPRLIAAARGYRAWLKAHAKPPAEQSAQSFVRDESGWEQWLRYTPTSEGTTTTILGNYALASPEGRAITNLHEIAGLGNYLRSVMIRNGAVNYLKPISRRLLALADVPSRSAWVELNQQQAAAWDGLLRDAVSVRVRPPMRGGAKAPWPWPPSIEGKIYADTGPPTSFMSEDDMAADFT